MSNILNVSVSGLLTAQSRLSLAQSNITNVNKENYHRKVMQQVPEMERRTMHLYTGNLYGLGADATNISRESVQFLEHERRLSQSHLRYSQKSTEYLNEMDGIYSTIGQRLTDSINNFREKMSNVQQYPSDEGLRFSLLQESHVVVDNIGRMSTQVDLLSDKVADEVDKKVQNLNQLLANVAQINQYLIQNSVQHPDLLDRRDHVVHQLSQFSGIHTYEDPSGAVTVLLGGVKTLVSKTYSATLNVIEGNPRPEQSQLEIQFSHSKVQVETRDLGGSISSLFEYRDKVLLPARDHIDVLATQLAGKMNQIQEQGFDLDGQITTPWFTSINSPQAQAQRSFGYDHNEGQAQISSVVINEMPDVYQKALNPNISHVGDVVGAEYNIRIYQPLQLDNTNNVVSVANSLQLDITNQHTQETTRVVYPPATATFPVNLADLQGKSIFGEQLEDAYQGFHLTFDDLTQLASEDQFMVRPFAGMAANLEVLLEAGEQIAAASGLQYEFTETTTAAAVDRQIPKLVMQGIDRSDFLQRKYIQEGYQIKFGYDEGVAPAGAVAGVNHHLRVEVFDEAGEAVLYREGAEGDFPSVDLGLTLPNTIDNLAEPYAFSYLGMRFEMDQNSLQQGDSFGHRMDFGRENNLNITEFQGLLNHPAIQHVAGDPARFTFVDFYEAQVTRIGTETAASKLSLESASDFFQFLDAKVSGKIGVNLDEEAADLVRFRQAYQASAQILETASMVIEELIRSMN
jgi:flagellar hook-associated protein 1